MKTLLLILIFAVGIFAQYDEAHRPQLHFSPPAHWMNDPNGMVYANGEYHLFYQYYPEDTVWGPMHWGHAVSRDLIHWENLPIALYPDKLGYIFSGSAVFDKGNSSGLGTKKNPPLVAMFTYYDPKGAEAGRKNYQYQGIAYSVDDGRTWTKYENNPVIPNTENLQDFRDTKLFWNEKLKSWSVIFAIGDHVRFYNSPDLKNWKMTGEFGKTEGSHAGVWECPDIFPLKIGGKTKWVLLLSINPGGLNGGSATTYFIGDFDGRTFKNDNPPETVLWLDHGSDNYAGVTWSNAPKNRRIFLGWMSNWEYAQKVPTEKWRSAMTLPRELSLRNTGAGIRLIQMPVRETEKLRVKQFLGPKNQIVEKELSVGDGKSSLVEMELEIDLSQTTADNFGVELSNSKGENYRIGFDVGANKFYSDRIHSGKNNFSEKFGDKQHFAERSSKNKSVKIHLVFDVASVEMFADDGEIVMTDIFFPSEDFTNFKIYSNGGKTFFSAAKAWNLNSIWR